MSARDRFVVRCPHCRQRVRIADWRFSTDCPICANVIPALVQAPNNTPQPSTEVVVGGELPESNSPEDEKLVVDDLTIGDE